MTNEQTDTQEQTEPTAEPTAAMSKAELDNLIRQTQSAIKANRRVLEMAKNLRLEHFGNRAG